MSMKEQMINNINVLEREIVRLKGLRDKYGDPKGCYTELIDKYRKQVNKIVTKGGIRRGGLQCVHKSDV